MVPTAKSLAVSLGLRKRASILMNQAAGERNCRIQQLPKLGRRCYNRQVVKTKDTYILLGLGLLLTGARVVPLSTLDAILDLADNVGAGYD